MFNCVETFAQVDRLDYLLRAVLEAEGYAYTGSPPSALMITRNKGMTKKVLAHHDVKVPAFRTYRKNDEVKEDPSLPFPPFAKPWRLDASEGIALSSVVNDTETLAECIRFIHERIGCSAITEQFIEGRELYVPLLGNGDDIEILPISEMFLTNRPPSVSQLALRSGTKRIEKKGASKIVLHTGSGRSHDVKLIERAALLTKSFGFAIMRA